MEEQRAPLHIALMNQSSALTLMYCLELMGSQGSYSLKAFLDRMEEDGGKTHSLLLKDPRIIEIKLLIAGITKEHPKIQRLVELIKEHRYSIRDRRNTSNSKILVFTQYRDTARHIVNILSRNGILSSRFVGQAKRQGDEGMKQSEQASVLESFKNGEFDVLVATSIAEEGLDIPEVDLVVFYEPIPSEIRYIQRKGRTGRKSAGMVTILAANDTVDMRHLYASNQRVEKMKKSLSMINTVLKPINRTFLESNPMTSEELSIIENRRRRLDERLDKTVESERDKGRLLNTEIANRINYLRESKKQSSLLLEAELVTGKFMRQVYRAARSIHSELAKAGRRGIDVDILHDNLAFEYPVLIEALKKLEKLKRVEWLDDTTIVIPDSLKQVPGKMYVIHIEKILQGKALVIVDDKWHARLNHYDYEGPRELLKSGSELRVIGELYHDDGVLNIRVKQIV
jgi:Fanconi anemia group M protein